MLLGLLGACARSSDAEHYTLVEYARQRPGIVHDGSVPVRYELPADTQWTPLSLPHVMPRPLVGTPIVAAGTRNDWTTHWYRMRHATHDIATPLAIYIPRWHRTLGQLDVYVNGDHVATVQNSTWNQPLFIAIPAGFAAHAIDGDIDVLIAASLQHSGSAALSTIWVGDSSELRLRHDWRHFLQLSFPQIASASFLILGAFAFAFWLKRRDEAAYWLFAAMALVNFFRTLHYHIHAPAWLSTWFWWLTVNSLAWLMVLANLFALRMYGQHLPRIEHALVGFVASVAVVSAAVPALGVPVSTLSPLLYLVQIATGILIVGVTTASALRNHSRTGLAVAIVLWLCLLMGAHDWLLQNWKINLESVYLLPYGAMCMMAVFLHVVLQRYLGAIQQSEELNSSLEQRLAERGHELETSYEKLQQVEREQVITLERQRLMREMHDGLGSSLMSSLAMVERGDLDQRAVARVLRESIDDLKLTIDSLEPLDHDLPTLLGTLRYRLGKRLELAGLHLDWRVGETPSLPWLNPTTALQVLRILQESLTNILKHAQATVVRVETEYDEQSVIVRLTDNGRGFNVTDSQTRQGGRGLDSMRRRAESLRGRLEIVSQPGRTSVTLVLPRTARY